MAVTQEVRNKVVVRKLPPGISCEEVRTAIDVVCQGKYDWFTFVPGKVRCAKLDQAMWQTCSNVCLRRYQALTTKIISMLQSQAHQALQSIPQFPGCVRGPQI